MNARGRRRACTPAEASTRLRHAEAFFATAQLVASEEGKPTDYDYNHVAAGVAVLAAIAASDALCCKLLGERARGQDHRQAIEVLEEIRYGEGNPAAQQRRTRELSQALATALDIKDESHYGTRMLTAEQVTRVMRAAEKLVSAARRVIRGGV
ncbi:hypothetical protein [Phytoactinopolyspora mesophila]|uniref:HEPN domain-containing protein n=1 Tax=Phytoactinopolyspora mesophila TaxID=2650750 RepID=A0A7K3MAT3_9ACTN|nr:hypothetical protein [Phytoactinopolyspora mesophila]NDL60290.1 hypothetical protein [Phytoactinopolyspora mesophila]